MASYQASDRKTNKAASVMTYLYAGIIFISLSFNSFVQSYAYTAWRYNLPLKVLITANGDFDKALAKLSLAELMEIKTS